MWREAWMRRSAAMVVLLALVAPSRADDVPFAEPRPFSGSLEKPSLGDLMSIVQIRHIKLWFAGRAQNWELLAYEAQQISDALGRSAMLYRNIPVELLVAINEPVRGIARAAREKNAEVFQASYAGLLSACNSCHAAAGVGFIRIQTPTAFPFSDQALSPQGRN